MGKAHVSSLLELSKKRNERHKQFLETWAVMGLYVSATDQVMIVRRRSPAAANKGNLHIDISIGQKIIK